MLAQSAVFASETDGFIYPRHYSIEVGNVCVRASRRAKREKNIGNRVEKERIAKLSNRVSGRTGGLQSSTSEVTRSASL